jgi:hypothetical protein
MPAEARANGSVVRGPIQDSCILIVEDDALAVVRKPFDLPVLLGVVHALCGDEDSRGRGGGTTVMPARGRAG